MAHARLELDFVIQYNAKLLPVEVKAVRFSMLPYKEQWKLKCVPLYAV